jgi:hypothetical protein
MVLTALASGHSAFNLHLDVRYRPAISQGLKCIVCKWPDCLAPLQSVGDRGSSSGLPAAGAAKRE